jgi:proline dehydrogenase
MALMRSLLLAGSQSRWLREQATRRRFVRRAVSRFMPGETVDDALAAARILQDTGISPVLTHLGENITDPAEADAVTRHYLDVLDRIRMMDLRAEVSVKPTQLGLDLGSELCYANLSKIIEHAGSHSVVWIDMEASGYVDATLGLYRRARAARPNVGLCVQAYLYRTQKDLESLLPLDPAIRLVKGAYKEPASVAFPQKRDVDENFFSLGQQLLAAKLRGVNVRVALATHDTALIRRLTEAATSMRLPKDAYEFQMLYGIQRAEQVRLAEEGWQSVVLVAYGSFWFPWYMRRLAERPANIFFVLRNLFAT